MSFKVRRCWAQEKRTARFLRYPSIPYWKACHLTESSRVESLVSVSTKRELDSGQLVVLAVRWRLQIWIKAAITYMQLQLCLVQ
jgi:hypothetical protein